MWEEFKKWREKANKKAIEQETVNRRESIIYALFNDMESEDSIEMYKNITEIFKNKLERRLDRINNEKKAIELWKQLS
jgi:flagellin-specific chaperone FliS